MNNEAEERCKYELFVEEYFGLIPEITNEETKVVTDYGQLVNLLTTFESKFKNGVGKPVVDTESGLNIDIVINNEVAVCGLYAEAADCKHRVKAQCKFSGKCYFKQTDC